MGARQLVGSILLGIGMVGVVAAADIDLSGYVYQDDGSPEPNVIVRLTESGLTDTTDNTGAYRLSNATSARPKTLDIAPGAIIHSRSGVVYLSLAGTHERVRTRVFSLHGRLVGELCDKVLEPGRYAFHPSALLPGRSGAQTLVVEIRGRRRPRSLPCYACQSMPRRTESCSPWRHRR